MGREKIITVNRTSNYSSEFMVRVSAGGGFPFRGTIEHIQSAQKVEFNDFLEMIQLISCKLDEKGHPPCETEFRSFND